MIGSDDCGIPDFQWKHPVTIARKQDTPFLRELCRRDDVFPVDLENPFGNTGCVIMASGLGKRFGGNKLMVPFRGAPLICGILDATEGIFARRVVVTRHESVAELCRARGIPVVFHNLPHRSDTVRLGLEAMDGIERCMFCPGDQPFLRRETVAALVLNSKNDPDSIWRAAWEDTPGSPVVFPKWAFPELLCLPEGKGGGVLIRKYPQRIRTIRVGDALELKDIDTPEDLTEWMG